MTARKSPLRTVRDGEKAPAAKPKTVAQAAKSGSHRELLVAMRDRVATAVAAPDCPARELASLTKRLADIAKEIEAIDARGVDDPSARARELESALREVAPDHEMLTGIDEYDDSFDAEAL